MKSQTFRVAFSAFLVAAAMGLAAAGPAHAQSVMKQCGDEWKAAKANNTTNGMTWQQFLAQCRAQKAAAPAAARPQLQRLLPRFRQRLLPPPLRLRPLRPRQPRSRPPCRSPLRRR